MNKLVKKTNFAQSLLLLSAVAGAGFLFIQNRDVISQGFRGVISRPVPLAQAEEQPKTIDEQRRGTGDVTQIMGDDRRRKTPRVFLPLKPEVRRTPTRTEERRTETGRVQRETRRVKRLGEVVRKPQFLSAKERASREATTRKFGLTRRPSTKEGRKRVSGRATKLALFEEQEKARKIFDARGITNF